MNRSSHGSSKIGWTWRDVTKMIIVCEFGNIFEFFEGQHESLENLSDVRSFLHRDDSELIFFIDPNKERLGIIVEDSSVIRPVSIDTACLEEPVSLFEKEMVCNQLILLSWCHGAQAIIFTFQVSIKCFECLQNISFNFLSLLWCVNTWL